MRRDNTPAEMRGGRVASSAYEGGNAKIRQKEAEIRELCDHIKEHLNCIDCTTDDLINVAERIVTKLFVIRQLEEKL